MIFILFSCNLSSHWCSSLCTYQDGILVAHNGSALFHPFDDHSVSDILCIILISFIIINLTRFNSKCSSLCYNLLYEELSNIAYYVVVLTQYITW